MIRVPIGVTIRKIVQQKNLSVKRLSEEIGISRQQVYNTYTRTNLHEGEVSKWAAALKVSEQELISGEAADYNRSADNGAFGEETLLVIKKMLEEELREKNEQIKALQEALRESQQMSRVLLGKSPERPDGRVLTNVFTVVDAKPATATVG